MPEGAGYGPFRLGPVDTFIALNAMRLGYGECATRFAFGLLLFAALVSLGSGLWHRDLILVLIGVVVIGAVFVALPMLVAGSVQAFTLHVTPDGLVSRTDDEVTLYRSLDLGRRRLVLGRMLIQSGGRKVIIVPLRQLPGVEYERLSLALDASA